MFLFPGLIILSEMSKTIRPDGNKIRKETRKQRRPFDLLQLVPDQEKTAV